MAKKKTSKKSTAPRSNGHARTADLDFVRAWKAAAENDGHVRDVAADLGLKAQSVYQRAVRLRRAGVQLPPLARARKAVDVDGLNAELNA